MHEVYGFEPIDTYIMLQRVDIKQEYMDIIIGFDDIQMYEAIKNEVCECQTINDIDTYVMLWIIEQKSEY